MMSLVRAGKHMLAVALQRGFWRTLSGHWHTSRGRSRARKPPPLLPRVIGGSSGFLTSTELAWIDCSQPAPCVCSFWFFFFFFSLVASVFTTTFDIHSDRGQLSLANSTWPRPRALADLPVVGAGGESASQMCVPRSPGSEPRPEWLTSVSGCVGWPAPCCPPSWQRHHGPVTPSHCGRWAMGWGPGD